jgi:hypothetical protein
MTTVPTDSVPEATSRLPEIAFLRRVDVLDADLKVLLRGTARDSLVEGQGERLAPAIAAEVEEIIRTHDFTRRPIATGLVGTEYTLRIVRTTGPAGSFYTVFSERTLLRRRLAQIGQRFRLTPAEAELLRWSRAATRSPRSSAGWSWRQRWCGHSCACWKKSSAASAAKNSRSSRSASATRPLTCRR